jgi:pyrroloquinoline quinone biosynthesis protein B
MIIRVLGSAAGGGFPQWNCSCPTCRAVREGGAPAVPRSQSSLAVRASDGPWFLVNASPDVRQQLELLREAPADGVRSSPIAGVVLTDAEIDHTTGLLILREGAEPLQLWSTEAVRRALTTDNPLLRVLDGYSGVSWHPLEPGRGLSLGAGGSSAPLEVVPLAVGGDPPRFVRDSAASGEDAVALALRDPATGGRAMYAPVIERLDDAMMSRLEACDCILVDGTFWRDDELAAAGIGGRTALEMGHMPLSGPDGSLERLARLKGPRTILVHINNTNPILLEDSAERRAVESAGIEIAYDGMLVEL